MTSRSRDAEEQAARRRRDARLLGLVALALVVVLVGGGIAVQHWRTSRAPAAAPTATATASFAPVPVVSDKPLVLGQPGAKVRLTLYEDFHCPYCAEFEDKLGGTIAAEQEAGRVLVELYPMAFEGPGSAAAANAMACAAEAGFGQPYYLGLFANHTLQWSDQQLLDLAGKVSTNVPASFTSCVKSKAHRAWVDSINTTAAANGVSSTPTVLLDGRPVDWSTLTSDSLRTMIDTAARS